MCCCCSYEVRKSSLPPPLRSSKRPCELDAHCHTPGRPSRPCDSGSGSALGGTSVACLSGWEHSLAMKKGFLLTNHLHMSANWVWEYHLLRAGSSAAGAGAGAGAGEGQGQDRIVRRFGTRTLSNQSHRAVESAAAYPVRRQPGKGGAAAETGAALAPPRSSAAAAAGAHPSAPSRRRSPAGTRRAPPGSQRSIVLGSQGAASGAAWPLAWRGCRWVPSKWVQGPSWRSCNLLMDEEIQCSGCMHLCS